MSAQHKIIPFELPHLALMDPHPELIEGHRAMMEGISDASILGQAYTVLRSDKVVLCCGVRPQQAKVGMAWSVMSDDVGRYDALYALRHMKRYIDAVFSQGLYRRVEMLVCDDSSAGIRHARLLGFEAEGLMRKRGLKGEDVIMYARIEP